MIRFLQFLRVTIINEFIKQSQRNVRAHTNKLVNDLETRKSSGYQFSFNYAHIVFIVYVNV